MNNMETKPAAIVVNDDPTQLAILAGLLVKAGIEAHAFAEAEAALITMDPARPPDLIVTDLYMPGIDGWRFCRLLRSPEYAAYNEIPILVVSATFAGDHPARIAADIGADAFLPSPVDGRAFVSQVQGLLTGKEARLLPRALIVEDSKTLAGLLKKTFAAHGYMADVALSAREAEAAFAKTPYNVTVLDYHLPDGTGDALLDAFRMQRPECVCLMMTAESSPELALSWMKRGAAAYLRKPFEPELLIELCARARRERALLRIEDLLEVRTRELRESEERYRLFFEGIDDAAFVHELDEQGQPGCFLDCNEAACRRLGYQRDELLSLTPRDITDPAEYERLAGSRGELTNQGNVLIETVHVAKNGRRIPVEGNVRRITYLGRPAALSVSRDITERKRAEERDRLAREEWERTFNAIPDLICILDTEHRILRANTAIAKKLGVAPAEAVGLTCHHGVHGTQSPPDFCPHAMLLRDHKEHTVEVREDRLGGDFLVTCTPLWNQERQLIGSVHVARDITERKRAEEALKESEAKNRALLAAIPDNMFVFSKEGFFIACNAVDPDLLLLPPQAFLNKHVSEVLSPEMATMTLDKLEKLFQSRQPQMYEYQVEIRGQPTYFEARIVIASEDSALAIVRDITARRRAELAERDERADRELIGCIATEAINTNHLIGFQQVVLPLLGKALDVSRTYVFTYRHDSQMMDNTAEWVAPGVTPQQSNLQGMSADPTRWWIATLMRGEAIQFADIEDIPDESTINDLRSQDIRAVLVIPLFIGTRYCGFIGLDECRCRREWTPRERNLLAEVAGILMGVWAEDAAKLNESYLSTILENQPGLVWLKDTRSCFLAVNSAFAVSCGLDDPSQLRGKSDLDIWPVHLAEKYRADDAVVMAEGKPKILEELIFDQGVIKWFETFKSPVFNDQGDVIGTTGFAQDITEGKLAEEALRESERRLADVIEFLPDATLAIDRDKRIIVWNKAIEEMTGISSAEMIGQGAYAYALPFYGERRPLLMDLVFADSAETAARYPAITRQGGTLIAEVFCNALYSGRGAWVFVKVSPLHDAAGQVIGAIESIRDITERKRAEEARRESEERFRMLASESPISIVAFDQDGQVTFVSDWHLTKFAKGQLGPEFFLARKVWELPSLISSGETDKVRRILAGESVCADEVYVPSNSIGREAYQSMRGVPFRRDGAIVGGVLIREDITERKQAEESLLASERRARVQRTALAQLALHPSFAESDTSRAFQVVAKSIAETLDVARASIWTLSEDGSRMHCCTLYQSDSTTFSSGAELVNSSFPCYFEAIMTENRIYAEDAQNDPRTSELTETYLKPLGITSILDSGIIIEGYLRGVVCSEHLGPIRQWHPDEEAFLSTVAAMVAQFLVNVERKQAEEEREILQAQLIQAQKMESVGRLAGGVAHDFNNMLGVILGYTGLVLEQTNPSDPLSKYLQQIHKAAERSADLTRQLLAFARKQTVAPQVLDLNNTVEGMLRLLRRLIGEDIDLAWLPGRELWPVKMDHSQLDQILANLCVNARDAIAGVGKVTIETANTVFDAEYCARHAGFVPGDYVLLAVSDNGCGMDAETLSRIFEPFFTTKEVGQGTGLGLASVYGAVTQNNGLINTYSEPGQGTTFKIYLPRHTDIVVQATAEPQQAAARGSETVLLVEDEPMMLELTMSMLEQLGYTVLAARTPGEAMRLAREHSGSIDLLITDVVMPEMNGRDLAGNLLALYPGMKCLLMSGYTANVIAHHGVLEEGVHFLEKPFLMTDLAANIRKALGQ